jgi:hypothetical protein
MVHQNILSMLESITTETPPDELEVIDVLIRDLLFNAREKSYVTINGATYPVRPSGKFTRSMDDQSILRSAEWAWTIRIDEGGASAEGVKGRVKTIPKKLPTPALAWLHASIQALMLDEVDIPV